MRMGSDRGRCPYKGNYDYMTDNKDGVRLDEYVHIRAVMMTLTNDNEDGVRLDKDVHIRAIMMTLMTDNEDGVRLRKDVHIRAIMMTLTTDNEDGVWLGEDVHIRAVMMTLTTDNEDGVWLGEDVHIRAVMMTLMTDNEDGVWLGKDVHIRAVMMTLTTDNEDGVWLGEDAALVVEGFARVRALILLPHIPDRDFTLAVIGGCRHPRGFTNVPPVESPHYDGCGNSHGLALNHKGLSLGQVRCRRWWPDHSRGRCKCSFQQCLASVV